MRFFPDVKHRAHNSDAHAATHIPRKLEQRSRRAHPFAFHLHLDGDEDRGNAKAKPEAEDGHGAPKEKPRFTGVEPDERQASQDCKQHAARHDVPITHAQEKLRADDARDHPSDEERRKAGPSFHRRLALHFLHEERHVGSDAI